MDYNHEKHKHINSVHGSFSKSHADNICIFSHHDANNNVAEYVLHYLKSLKNTACDIIFVSTADQLCNNHITKLLEHCKVVIMRNNIGYDFGSYKCGIDFIDNLKEYNKLILANDHIQSYFLVYSNSVIASPSFKKFWNHVAYISDDTPDFKKKIIENYEIGGSSHFIAHGFKLGALCDNNDITHYVKNSFLPSLKSNINCYNHLNANVDNALNPTHFYWDILIEKFQFPFIKREILVVNPLNINIDKWTNLIQKVSDFHYNLIIKHLNSLSQLNYREDFKWFFTYTKTEPGISVPYFLTQLLTIWPELKKTKTINFNTENGVLNAIAWWENPGRHNSHDICWPQKNIFPDTIYQKETSIQQDVILYITKGAMAVLRTRGDMKNININTTFGRIQFILWRLTHGSKEYRFLRFTNEELASLLSPSTAFGGKLKHLPQISQLLICLSQTNEGILNSLNNGDIDTYESRWNQDKDFLLRLVSDNTHILEEKEKENKFSAPRPLGTLSPYGINTIGFPRAFFGIAEDVRTATQSLLQAKIPTAVCSVPIPLSTKVSLSTTGWIENFIRKEPTYQLNLINLPAADTFHLLFKGWSGLFSSRYNIAAWQWELPHWPNKWLPFFNMIDEIWAISHFTEKLFKQYTDKPVIYMPLAIDNPSFKAQPRSLFNIPNDAFAYLSVFDCNSWVARKNPIAAAKAFMLAFPKTIIDTRLVIKIIHSSSHIKEFIELMELIKQDNRILVIDETLSRNNMLALINCCDVFVSLHRSEGFGRVIAESMLLGKPVISTNYSGSLDFAHEETAFIVNGPIVELKKGDYVEHEGQHWMDPDIKMASEQFKICYENSEQAAIIAERGQLFVEENHSIDACAARYASRLKEIGKIKNW